ncbi:hypothetical protein [Halorussus salinisoli]|uniref:hypothetical protein n=1 Tax=Halorussus salinisoli TaxID=2558242 RepID=UPI0010C1CC64|nr:hypothetical protein [Halorussus salinisoli]
MKDEDRELHSYNGMVDQFTVTDERNGVEPEATIELSLSSVDTSDDEESRGRIDVDEDVRGGQHTVAVHFEDSQVYPTGVGHDVHLICLDETTSIDDVNGWMDWRDPNKLVSDGTEPGTFLGGVQNISTPELMGRTDSDGQGDDGGDGNGGEPVTAYVHVDLNPGAYAWVSEVPRPTDKGLLKPFIVPFEQS